MINAATLKTRAEFTSVYERGRRWQGRYLALRVLKNQLDVPRFGYSIGKEVGKAVVRNRVRRRLKAIVRDVGTTAGWDVVLMARRGAGEAAYVELRESVKGLLARARACYGDEEVGSGTN